MTKSAKFVPTTIKIVREQNVASLALKREALKQQIAELNVELDECEAKIRSTVGLGYRRWDKSQGEIIEVEVRVEPRPMLDKDKVLALVGEKKMPLCYSDTNQNRIYVKRVDMVYVKKEYV